MPDFNTPGLQSAGAVCSLKSLTKAQPFNLTTETRGAEKKAKLDSAYQIKDESGTFKAREMPDFEKSARNLSVSRSEPVSAPPHPPNSAMRRSTGAVGWTRHFPAPDSVCPSSAISSRSMTATCGWVTRRWAG